MKNQTMKLPKTKCHEYMFIVQDGAKMTTFLRLGCKFCTYK